MRQERLKGEKTWERLKVRDRHIAVRFPRRGDSMRAVGFETVGTHIFITKFIQLSKHAVREHSGFDWWGRARKFESWEEPKHSFRSYLKGSEWLPNVYRRFGSEITRRACRKKTDWKGCDWTDKPG